MGGKQKLYLPIESPNAAGHGVVAVVDVGVAGNGTAGAPALITDIDLGTVESATTTAADPTTVIAASTENRKIWFIDPNTDQVTKTIELDMTYGQSGFSGGGGYVTGIAIDSASHRAILSVWNGFAILDLGTQSITKVIQAPPSENFGFDSVHGRIIAPFYDCTTSKNTMGPPSFCGDFKGADGMPMTDGLNIIDLSDDAVYTYQNPAAKNPLQPVGDEPDSAAIDPNTGLAVIPSEGSNFASVIDVSKARFDRGAKTFTAPTELIDKAGLEGIAMEATQHIAFWEQEHSSRIAVADLTKQPASSTYAEALMPYLPSGAAWSNIGDPHGIAVTTGIRDSAPVGFVVTSDRKWVARVDLKKMLSLPRTPLTNQIEAKDIMTAVTFLDARTKL